MHSIPNFYVGPFLRAVAHPMIIVCTAPIHVPTFETWPCARNTFVLVRFRLPTPSDSSLQHQHPDVPAVRSTDVSECLPRALAIALPVRVVAAKSGPGRLHCTSSVLSIMAATDTSRSWPQHLFGATFHTHHCFLSCRLSLTLSIFLVLANLHGFTFAPSNATFLRRMTSYGKCRSNMKKHDLTHVDNFLSSEAVIPICPSNSNCELNARPNLTVVAPAASLTRPRHTLLRRIALRFRDECPYPSLIALWWRLQVDRAK